MTLKYMTLPLRAGVNGLIFGIIPNFKQFLNDRFYLAEMQLRHFTIYRWQMIAILIFIPQVCSLPPGFISFFHSKVFAVDQVKIGFSVACSKCFGFAFAQVS